MKKVLIVDDDPNISELLRLYFDKDGFAVITCYDGISAYDIFVESRPDVVILDLMLPGRDGYDIMRDIRRSSDTPVIMLTARGDTLDKVVGLELGADDYVQKPFEPKELMARVKAVLRRSESSRETYGEQDLPDDSEAVEYSNLRVDKSRYTVRVGDREIEMPPKELELLFFLATHPNRVFTREQLLENVWGYDFYGESRTVDVHIKRIREKLDAASAHSTWQIKTVWGVGYKFETA
ncbi:MAG: response regulator transcription factor [Clostridia bacterium]|nr:response regulator transcription factor [Eubacteriales bacterium]MDD3867491.1 response regulator transcription factor [Eubacteriales bacterium]MDD4462166.1 response regulator transcription factor [Eubacteriales bacterium]NCC49124.1 response regulator transcription factor [Clostridia bacterium]